HLRRDVRGAQRPGGGVAPELVGDQREIDESETAQRSSAVVLVDEQAGPAEFGPGTPVVGCEAVRIVAEAADPVRRHPLREEPCRGVAEELLIRTRIQQHACPFTPSSEHNALNTENTILIGYE